MSRTQSVLNTSTHYSCEPCLRKVLIYQYGGCQGLDYKGRSPNTATSYSCTHGVVRISTHAEESQPRVCITDGFQRFLYLRCGNRNISLPSSLWKLSQDLQASELALIPKAGIRILLPLVTRPWVVPSCRVV